MRSGFAPLSMATLVVAASAAAQTPPPETQPGYPPGAGMQPAPVQPGVPGAQPAPVQPAAPGAPGAQPAQPVQPGVPGAQPAPGQPVAAGAAGAPGAPAAAGATVEGGYAGDPMFDFGGEAAAAETGIEPPSELTDEDRAAMRRLSLELNNNIRGSTGLLRLSEAYSSAPGTFRMSFFTGFFSGSGFLCDGTDAGGCDYDGDGVASEDKVSRVASNFGLSVSLTSFLEAFVGIHAHATANDQGRPELLQVLGDTNWGLKAFAPKQPNQIWGVGGELELWMLNGTGGVGVDGAGTSFAMRLLSSIDLNNKVAEEERIPFRAHLNVGYKFNNGGKLVEDTEVARGDERGVNRIYRFERFGLDIDRVDAFELGVGFESPLPYVRPFLEWTFDIPVQRQEYICNISRLDDGDGCLGNDAGFKTTPSRIGLGARIKPGLDGLNLMAAVEIATGGASEFIEEVAPELPWQLHFGVAYNADPKGQGKPIIKEVEVDRIVAAPPEPDRVILGKVVDETSGEPVPNAVIRFTGRNITGMVSNTDGTFQTIPLDPGQYAFSVAADGYRAGECSASVPAAAPTQPAAPMGQPQIDPVTGQPMPAAAAPIDPVTGQPAVDPVTGQPIVGQPAAPQPGTPGVTTGTNGELQVPMECKLKALPKVGNVVGTAVDAESGQPIEGAQVTIQDKLGRELELQSDTAGTFRFENVPPGTVKLFVEAPGYLRNVVEVDVKAQEDTRARLGIHKRPAKANVVVTYNEVQLKKQVHFEHNSATLLPDSMAILSEAADVLRDHAELRVIEIQGHTDNTGSAAYNTRLSQERADAVKDALVTLGVESSRLTTRGYGQDQPLVPNVSDANRARNRRVVLKIMEKN